MFIPIPSLIHALNTRMRLTTLMSIPIAKPKVFSTHCTHCSSVHLCVPCLLTVSQFIILLRLFTLNLFSLFYWGQQTFQGAIVFILFLELLLFCHMFLSNVAGKSPRGARAKFCFLFTSEFCQQSQTKDRWFLLVFCRFVYTSLYQEEGCSPFLCVCMYIYVSICVCVVLLLLMCNYALVFHSLLKKRFNLAEGLKFPLSLQHCVL